MPAPGGNPPLAEYEAELGLPPGFVLRKRPGQVSGPVATVIQLRSRHPRRRYLEGVLLAYVAMAEELLAQTGEDAIDDVLQKYRPLAVDASGRALNTLTLEGPSQTISLRNYYNQAETVIRHHLLRTGYPNSAPHATQSWTQHRREFELIAAMTPGERARLLDEIWKVVLELPEMASQAGAERRVRPFERILTDFPNTQRGEPAGALLQGLAYAYYRADSPNVTLRIYKVGSGSSRVGATGDVDGWVGDVLRLSVEVKDEQLGAEDMHKLDQFVMNLRRWPDCTAVVLAREFTEDARVWITAHSILCLDRGRMASNVSFWDVPKQQLAVRELLYFLGVIQQNAKLLNRFKDFCATEGVDLGG